MSDRVWHLRRGIDDRLLLVDAAGSPVPAKVVALFPLSAPAGPFALVDSEGRELAYVPNLAFLGPEDRALLREELACHLFLPQIKEVLLVSDFDFPSTWQVLTDHGPTELRLPSEDCFRRLGRYSLLIREQSGLEFRVADWNSLDKRTRKILERFL
jgi:hypothetical protein